MDRRGIPSGSAEIAKDLPCDKALETTNDLHLAFTLCRSSTDIVEGWWVAAHPDNDHTIQSRIGLTMASAVEPVTRGLAARGGNGTGATELGTGLVHEVPSSRVVYNGFKFLLDGVAVPDSFNGRIGSTLQIAVLCHKASPI